ncbi:MAG: SlyX family protein [Pseudomonadota bacterium]|nr:SlyX family protein [Pseudomonadota bacterium]
MSDDLIELQTQLAFQEHTIAELNDVLTSQQQQIDLLRLEIKLLKDKLGVLEDRIEVGPPQNEKPPHY